MNILEEFYNGELKPWENFGCNTDYQYQALNDSAQQREKELIMTLSEEQLSLYKKITNDRSDMNNLELERMFIYAFKIGCRFTLDTFSE